VVPERTGTQPGHERAAAVLESGLRGDSRLVAPVLIVAEVGNVLWQRTRRGELLADEAREAWSAFEAAPIDLSDVVPLMPPVLEIALGTGRAIYDALYVALAEAEGAAKLVTADRRLVRVLEGTPFEGSVVML